MRIGITGHQTLRGELGWGWIDGEIRSILAGLEPPWIGITSLAAGADQHFARIVLELGGAIEVVVPFPDYESRFCDEEARSCYRGLLSAAHAVLVLPGAGDS